MIILGTIENAHKIEAELSQCYRRNKRTRKETRGTVARLGLTDEDRMKLKRTVGLNRDRRCGRAVDDEAGKRRGSTMSPVVRSICKRKWVK